MVVNRKVADVTGDAARLRLAADDDRHRAAFDAVPERQFAAACEPGLELRRLHGRSDRATSALICASNHSFVAGPGCLARIVPSRRMNQLTGMANVASYASIRSSWPAPTRTG